MALVGRLLVVGILEQHTRPGSDFVDPPTIEGLCGQLQGDLLSVPQHLQLQQGQLCDSLQSAERNDRMPVDQQNEIAFPKPLGSLTARCQATHHERLALSWTGRFQHAGPSVCEPQLPRLCKRKLRQLCPQASVDRGLAALQ